MGDGPRNVSDQPVGDDRLHDLPSEESARLAGGAGAGGGGGLGPGDTCNYGFTIICDTHPGGTTCTYGFTYRCDTGQTCSYGWTLRCDKGISTCTYGWTIKCDVRR